MVCPKRRGRNVAPFAISLAATVGTLLTTANALRVDDLRFLRTERCFVGAASEVEFNSAWDSTRLDATVMLQGLNSPNERRVVFPADNDSTFARVEPIRFDDIAFDDATSASSRWQRLTGDPESSSSIELLKLPLLSAVQEAAQPDQSLLNIERFLDAVPDRGETVRWLASKPRAIEILVRLFVGSPSLTELLVREPDRLRWLTDHRGLAEFPSRQDFVGRAKHELAELGPASLDEKIGLIRRYQRREILRIAACDTFHLIDLKTATRQLSLLADAIVEVVLEEHAEALGVSSDCVTVLAFGKLGGLELNYSSDIDLLFIGDTGGADETTLAQRTIRSLSQIGPDGFLYRVDMRLRPWGKSGALVVTLDRYHEYLQSKAELWEKQAILKARPVAGDLAMGQAVLDAVTPAIFDTPVDELRANVLAMKEKIERSLEQRGRSEGHVKSGEGGIRDIEFVTQFLQLAYGGDSPAVRTQNTMDALLRLFDVGALETDQYRALSAGYLFHRVVEHALQLQDMSARHALPTQPRELNHLAQRLDFPDADVFVKHYRGHCSAVRAVFNQIVGDATVPRDFVAMRTTLEDVGDPTYRDMFDAQDRAKHLEMRRRLKDRAVVVVVNSLGDAAVDVGAPQQESPERAARDRNGRAEGNDREPKAIELWIVGRDHPGDLALVAGLLQEYGFAVESADAFPGDVLGDTSDAQDDCFVDRLTIQAVGSTAVDEPVWEQFEEELAHRMEQLSVDAVRTHADAAVRVADSVRNLRPPESVDRLTPIEVVVDDERDDESTVLQIRTDDAPGVLYNLTTALALARLDVRRVIVRTETTSEGRIASDTFHVVDASGNKLPSERVLEIRAAIVLTTQFTNLLPHSPDPRRALVQFHEFLENLFTRPGWMSDLASLQDSRVLVALTKLLGVSEFLWDDFLRFQHENLFPIVRDLEGLQTAASREALVELLEAETSDCETEAEWVVALNRFKDREMLRVDMRQILNVQTAFNTFARELTAVAEVVVVGAVQYYAQKFAIPLEGIAACALGKCGGYEMGFASDIELMFLYDADRDDVDAADVERLVKALRKAIQTPRDGVFAIDLRLRPHGQAGSLAVSLDAFSAYFGEGGPAWPFERQALVKMRPLEIDPAGQAFAERVAEARNALLYVNRIPDVGAVMAMREMQVRQLVEADTFNVKLSPGGLVDAEYFVQLMQLRWGHLYESLRTTNTREALRALEELGYLTTDERGAMRDAYRFLRRVINGLRMVRGDAKDLTLPAASSDERVFLVRRLQPPTDPQSFDVDFRRHTDTVMEMTRSLASRIGSATDS